MVGEEVLTQLYEPMYSRFVMLMSTASGSTSGLPIVWTGFESNPSLMRRFLGICDEHGTSAVADERSDLVCVQWRGWNRTSEFRSQYHHVLLRWRNNEKFVISRVSKGGIWRSFWLMFSPQTHTQSVKPWEWQGCPNMCQWGSHQ